MKIGNYDIKLVNFGNFALDGGSMFGSVPKNLWEKRIEPDAQNRIPLATNSLLLESKTHKILIDVGNGDKWSEKLKAIFCIENFNIRDLGFDFNSITDVILTHLHFDHAGGISDIENDSLVLRYPNAKVHVQKSNYLNAKNPTIKERASYLSENLDPLKDANLNLIDGDKEILPNIFTHVINGHTEGQQWIEIKDEKNTLVFPSDLIPTSHHVPIAFHMGYDICAKTLLEEKSKFLTQASANNWIVVFQHDRQRTAARVKINQKNDFEISEEIRL